MTGPDERFLARKIEAELRSVEGVSAVLRSGTAVAQAVTSGARRLRLADDGATLVRCERSDNGLSVNATIAIAGSPGATEVAPRASKSIRDLLESHGADIERITVTVAHVDAS